MIKRVSISMVVFLLLVFSASAALDTPIVETGYPNAGGVQGDYLQPAGTFDTTVLSTTKTRPLTDGDHTALVEDLDGDGTLEIIVIDDGSIKLFRNADLEIVDTFNLASGVYSPPITSDIDNDGFIEIILANEAFSDGTINIIEYNGSVMKNDPLTVTNFPAAGTGGTAEILLQCDDGQGDPDDVVCLMAIARSPSGSGSRTMFFVGFNNETTSGDVFNFQVDSSTNTNKDYCFPKVPVMTNIDIDNDGDTEFIFGVGFFERFTGDVYKIYSIDVSLGLTPTGLSPSLVTYTSGFDPHETGTDCSTGDIGKFVSSPMIAQLDGSTSNGFEMVVGLSENADDFIMKVFDSAGNDIDTHPAVTTADGELLGNPMLANIFGDTGNVDYCTMGQDLDKQVLKLLCGSQQTGNTDFFFIPVNNVEFGFDITNEFNLSSSYNFPNTVSHQANMQEDPIDVTEGFFSGVGFTDTTEFIGPHGVFQVTTDDFPGLFTGQAMNRLFELNAESACIVVDAEQAGASDIICVKDTAVQYIDDNLVNGVAVITAHTEDPCIDAGPVKLNTTMQIKIIAQDQNDDILPQDLVTTTVKLYEGTSNEQVSVLANQTSGDEVTHLFAFPGAGINQTGSNIRLVYEAFDAGNPTEVNSITQTFTVSTAGVEFGDCQSGDVIGLPGVEEEITPLDELAAVIPDDDPDNAVSNAIITLSVLLGIGGTTIWLIIMIAISLGVWGAVMRTGPDGHPVVHGSSALGMIAILNLLMIIIGARLGILSTALVVIIVIIVVVIIGVFLGKFLTGLKAGAD